MDGGKVGDDLEPLPDVKQLKTIFRNVAKATVKAIVGTKKSAYGEALRKIGERIAKVHNVVVGKFSDDSAVKA